MKFLSVYITYPDKETADSITDILLNARLIACANIFPISSSYWWNGEIVKEAEWVSVVKTSFDRKKDLEEEVKKIHPYEVPCVMKTEVSANQEYVDWIIEQTSNDKS